MDCTSCASRNQAELTAEINVRFRGLQNLDKPGVLIFPKLLIGWIAAFRGLQPEGRIGGRGKEFYGK
jgi:hypothetical protein